MRKYDVQSLIEKWAPVLDHPNAPSLGGKKRDMAVILENSEQELAQAGNISGGQMLLGETAPTNSMLGSAGSGTDVDTFDPVLISMVRRAMPNLIAYDICGVQPMTGPTGLIFAMRARYTSQTGTEAFYGEANTAYATSLTTASTLGNRNVGTLPGNNTVSANLAEQNVYNFGAAMALATAEGLGSNGTAVFPEMAFSIEKVSVTAKTRALKAEYSMELAQDLKAIHGLDAESELANILSAEIMAEINREVVRSIYVTAKQGSVGTTAANGYFDLDVDANGRWSVEKFKGMLFHIEREANLIAKETRRGKGNIIMCSSDVASALQMAGMLDYAPALNTAGLSVDDTGNTFAGVLNGRYRVYIDPYALGGNFFVVGYKGSNAFDAGLFYCPYVPLQMVRAVDQATFQPKIGFKTRYGMVANPFAGGDDASNPGLGALTKDSNVYYRRTVVKNLL